MKLTFRMRVAAKRFTLTPALSRWERENRIQSHGKTERGVYRTVDRKQTDVHLLFPLPAGEGQGEGERGVDSHRDELSAKVDSGVVHLLQRQIADKSCPS